MQFKELVWKDITSDGVIVYKYQREYLAEKNRVKFSDNLEILVERQYKDIKAERILDISNTGIIPLGTDEIFVKLMDYKNAWLSNYGRMIRYSDGKYNLLQGSYDNYGGIILLCEKEYIF